MIELRILGTVDLRDDSGRAMTSVLVQPKRLALLVHLAMSPGGGMRRRDSLTALFWPESDAARARRALNQALYVLRQRLGNAVVTRGEEEVGVDPTLLRCDAAAFQDHLSTGDDSAAIETYRGSLLPGFFLSDCPAFEQWVEDERTRLNEAAVAVAIRLADREERRDNHAGAAHWLRRAGDLAPYREDIQRRLIGALEALGDRSGALHEFDSFSARLMRELEVEPSAELSAAARALRRKEGAGEAPAPAPASTPAPTPVPAPAGEVALRPAPLPRRRWPLLAAAGATVVALLLGIETRRREPARASEKRHRVLVMAFDNNTGDSSFAPLGRAAAHWITESLAQTGWAEVVSPLGSVRAERETDASSRTVGAAAASSLNATLVVEGHFVLESDSLVFQAQVVDPSTGRVERAVTTPRMPASHPLRAIEEARQRVLGTLATVLDARMSSWAPLASQPPSLHAYRAYSDGMDQFADGNMHGAAAHFREAAALDSSFTTPLVWALVTYWELGDFPRADSVIAALGPRSGTLPPWDRAMVDYMTARHRGHQEEAMRAVRRVARVAPESEWLFEQARQAYHTNRPHEALAVLEQLDPDRGWMKDRPNYWMLLANARYRVGDHTGELSAAEQLGARVGRRVTPPRLRALAALDSVDRALAEADWVLGNLPLGYATMRMLQRLALELRLRGHHDAATAVIDRALAALDAAPAAVTGTSLMRQQRAELLWVAGRAEAARPLFERGLRADPARPITTGGAGDPRYLLYAGPLGIIAAGRGDTAAAQHYDRLLESNRGPFDYGENSFWRAGIRAHLGDREGAVRRLRQALDEGYLITDWFFVHPALEPLRGYPSFEGLSRARDL